MTVRVDFNTSNIRTFKERLSDYIDDKCSQIAGKIAVDARKTSAFIDRTGGLRKSIRKRKSRFPDGGYIAKAGGPGAMQAWLIEHGGGRLKRPRPYLRPAFNKAMTTALRDFTSGKVK
jgi:hypothetical protein